jgi:hypothetical protein
MKYDKQRKQNSHANAVENATQYLLSLPAKKKVWVKPIQMVRLAFELRHNYLPPLEKGARL